jgi:hypothetical protein
MTHNHGNTSEEHVEKRGQLDNISFSFNNEVDREK